MLLESALHLSLSIAALVAHVFLISYFARHASDDAMAHALHLMMQWRYVRS